MLSNGSMLICKPFHISRTLGRLPIATMARCCPGGAVAPSMSAGSEAELSAEFKYAPTGGIGDVTEASAAQCYARD
jgi:hypothetical protein